ncbi:MAG: hypothetical protein ACI4VK_05440 [Candidatus Coproplasma sp.]
MENEEKFEYIEEPKEEKGYTVEQIGMLCATVIALLCEVFNLVEVIVNRRVSFSLFALSFFVVGIVPIIFKITKTGQNKKLFIVGTVCLVISLAFVVLWVLSLCGVIK